MSKSQISSAVQKAPVIYINDPTKDGLIVSELTKMIPKTSHISLMKHQDLSTKSYRTIQHYARDIVLVFSDKQSDCNEKLKKGTAGLLRELAIRLGCNFASINLRVDPRIDGQNWATNHLDLPIIGTADDVNDAQALELAKKIYKWLFTVLTVKDTLHLIPDEQMMETDSTTAFKDYEYCPIGNCSKVKKDAKVQFVALIVSKPAVVSGNKLVWQVADKTGVANFFFKFRGPSSQYTWDWVLSLEPGQRKSLPRMPCVLVKERLSTSLVKLPLRIPGSIIQVTGKTIQFIGVGVSNIGKCMKMGRRKRWVTKDDVADFLSQHSSFKVVPSKEEKTAIKVFTEQGTKAWKDNDSSRSTLWDEKVSSDEKKDTI